MKWYLAMGILAVSMSPLLIRLAQPADPVLISAARVWIAGLVLGGIGYKQWPLIWHLSRADKWLLLLSGCALAAHFALWISSMSLTSTAASVTLVATQPIFAGLLGMAVLGEGFARKEILGIGIAFVGCVILAGGDFGDASSSALIGDALAIGGAITVPVYLLVGRKLKDSVPLLPYLSAVNLIAGVALGAGALASGVSLQDLQWHNLLALLGLGLIPSVIGHTLLNRCVRSIPVHLVSLGILVEPAIAVLSTWLVFAEVPSMLVAIGGIVTLSGIYLGFGMDASIVSSKSARERQ